MANARDVPARTGTGPFEWLFVYGTLRKRGGQNSWLDGSQFLRPATIAGALYDLGRFPAAVLEEQGRVHGELWACSPETLRQLDSYEGVDEGLFRRTRIRIDGRECWIYVAGERLRSNLQSQRRIEEGVWPPPRSDSDRR